MVAWSALAVALALPAQDKPYRGKYEKDPRAKEAFAKLATLEKEALANVKEKLGLDVEPSAVVIEIEDAVPADPKMVGTFKGPALGTSTLDGSPRRARIVIHPEFVVSGRARALAQELVHECVHAAMRVKMSREDHRAVPDWLREGLAVWCAGQIEEKLAYTLVSQRAFREPEKVVLGLGVAGDGFDRYPEFGLAIELLEQRKAGSPAALVKLLVAGRKVEDAVAEVAGSSYADFVKAAKEHALERARKSDPPRFDEYLAIWKADQDKAREKARDLAEKFLEAHPAPATGSAATVDDSLAANVLYWHGKSCRLSKEGARGVKSLIRLADTLAHAGDFADEALYQLGSIALEAKQPKEAREWFERLLRDWPDTGNLETLLLRLATCDADLGDKKRAKERLDLLERSFPKHTLTKEVAGLRERVGK